MAEAMKVDDKTAQALAKSGPAEVALPGLIQLLTNGGFNPQPMGQIANLPGLLSGGVLSGQMNPLDVLMMLGNMPGRA